MEKFKFELDALCKKYGIEEIHFTLIGKPIKGLEISYEYFNISNDKFQFGEKGNITTNYKSK